MSCIIKLHNLYNFLILYSKEGFLSFWKKKEEWFLKEYHDRLINCRLDHRQFDDMQQQYLSGKTVIHKLAGDFGMLFDFKATCAKLPDFSYLENMELRVLVKDMIILDLPTAD